MALLGVAFLLAASVLANPSPQPLEPQQRRAILQPIGSRDALALADPDGHLLLARHIDKPLMPASILKIVTALAAFHYLGPDYRFTTDIYLDPHDNLIIEGHGDPLLTSEALQAIAAQLAAQPALQDRPLQKIVLDGSDFADSITIPGVTDSFEPYDAPNGALCANFNTVNFIKNAAGDYRSAEPQTPLLPMVLPRIQASGLKQGRIILSTQDDAHLKYTGHLLSYFLRRQGLSVSGPVEIGRLADRDAAHRLWRHSSIRLDAIVAQLMRYSNNFMANQLLLSCGKAAYGAPATLAKGAQAVQAFATTHLGIPDITIYEGSGISRRNRISAAGMLTALQAFSPHYRLLKKYDYGYYKTGTLTGVVSRAGYILDGSGRLHPFVLIFNSRGRHHAEAVVQRMASAIDR